MTLVRYAQLLTGLRTRADITGMYSDKTPNKTARRTGSQRGAVPAYLAAIVYLITASGIAGADMSGEREASARTCAGTAGMVQRINISSGVYTERAMASSPLYLDIPLGTDAHFYEECLQREGISPRDQVSAEFARVAACNTTADRSVVLVRRSPHSVRIASTIDVPAYSRCIDATVSVEAEIAPAIE